MDARRCDWLRCAMLLAALALSSADDDKCRVTVFTKNDKDEYKSDVVVSLSDPCDKTDRCITVYSKEEEDKKVDEIKQKKSSPNKDGKCPCSATLDDDNPKLFCKPSETYCWVPLAKTVWGTVESECKPDAKFGCRKYDTKEYDDDTSSSCPATKKDDGSKSPPKGDSSPSKKSPPPPKSKSGGNVTEPSTMDGGGVRLQSNAMVAVFTILMSTFAIFAL